MSSDDPDPHGTRGSTAHHALDYKKEVKSFSSADILAAYKAGARGEKDRGVPSITKEASRQEGTQPVKSFNSADLAANVSQAKSGGADTLTSKPTAAAPASATPPSAAQTPSGESGVKVRAHAAPQRPQHECAHRAALCAPWASRRFHCSLCSPPAAGA